MQLFNSLWSRANKSQKKELKSTVYEALMTAAIELEHQLILMLKSEHKLGYFDVLQGEKKIGSKKNSSYTNGPHRMWSCETLL